MATETTDIKLLVIAETLKALKRLDDLEEKVDGVGEETKKTNVSLKKFGRVLGGLGIALSIREVGQLTLEMTRLGQQARDVQNAFAKIPKSTRLLQDMRKAVRGTVPDVELMRTALQGIDLGATNEQLQVFAEFARFESVRKGSDALTTLGEIMGGVFRGSTELLDNFGFSLSAVNAEIENFAAAQGKTATELSAVERRGLLAEAVIKLMQDRLTEAGEIADSQAEAVRRNAAAWQNLQVRIGQFLSGPLAQLDQGMSTVITGINGLFDQLGIGGVQRLEELTAEYADFRKIFASQEAQIGGLLTRYEQLAGGQKLTAAEQRELNGLVDQLAALVPGAVSAVDDYGQALGINTSTVRAFIQAQKDLLKRTESDVFQAVSAEVREAAGDIDTMQGKLEKANREITQLTESGQEFVKAFSAPAGPGGAGVLVDIPTPERIKQLTEDVARYGDQVQQSSNDLDRLVFQLNIFEDLSSISSQQLATNLGITSEAADDLLTRFRRLNEEAAEPAKPKPGGETTVNKGLQGQKDALREKIRLNQIELDNTLSNTEKLQRAVEIRYGREIEEARKTDEEKARLLEQQRDLELRLIKERELAAIDQQIESLQQRLALDEVEIDATLDKYDKLRAAARIRYEEEIRIAKKTSAELAELKQQELKNELKKIDLQELRERQPERIRINFDANTDQLLAEYSRAIEGLNRFYQSQRELAKGNAELLLEIERDRAEQTKKLENDIITEISERILQTKNIYSSFIEAGTAAYDEFIQHLITGDTTGSEARKKIWEGAKAAFLQTTAEMLIGYVKSKLQEMFIDKAVETAKTKVRTAAAARDAALDAADLARTTASTTAKTGEAAAGFFSAHSGIPFAGFAIAAGFVATMMAMLSNIGGKADGGPIRENDLLSGIGPPGEDGVVGVQVGEYVIPRGPAQRYATLLDMIRRSGNQPLNIGNPFAAAAATSLQPVQAPALPASLSPTRPAQIIPVERVQFVPVGGEITLRTVAPEQAEIDQYYIGINRSILLPDAALVSDNNQTQPGEFE